MSSAHLVVVRGPETGLRFELDTGRVSLGSDPSCDIPLAGLAPRHCIISGEENSYQLAITTSGAECTLNSVPVSAAVLKDGDRIRLGEVQLLFRDPASSPPRGQRLMAACSLFYLFRAMHNLEDQAPLVAQIREIAADELGQGTLSIFVGECPAIGMVPPDTLIHSFHYGPNLTACLIWQSEDEAASEPAFAALAAIASAALETASEIANLEIRTSLAEEQLPSATGILGAAPATVTLIKQIEKVAPRETTVLIQGESGTGKELVARAIHQLSPRSSRPFVALNCAAIADNLLESELFGHEKGAFTGATELRQGKLELAAGGTVFLDEIGEMAMPLQAKMLRVLQQRECQRVGGRKTITLDIRIVAATNRDLAAEVKRGAFREDLYHRLNVVSLRTPPLRERAEDIELLAHAFLARAARAAGRNVEGFTNQSMAALRRYDWPGNIRELENVIERAVVLGDLNRVQLEDLPESILDSSSDDAPAFHRSIHGAKRSAILEAWRIASGDYKVAAAHLGVHPNSLLRMIRNLGLRAELGA